MNELDRAIIDRLHGNFPIHARPFACIAREFRIGEEELIARLAGLLDDGVLSRFGPMYQIERMGGAFSLAALRVPPADFERVARIVNDMPEVAHNYERAHDYNMWFVLATESPAGIAAAIAKIEQATGLAVLNLPKLQEFVVELNLTEVVA